MPDLVRDGVARAQHEHWDIRVAAPDALQQVGPCHTGQHQIQNNQVVVIRGRELQSAETVGRGVDGVAGRRQTASDESRDLGFVLHKENPHLQAFPPARRICS